MSWGAAVTHQLAAQPEVSAAGEGPWARGHALQRLARAALQPGSQACVGLLCSRQALLHRLQALEPLSPLCKLYLFCAHSHCVLRVYPRTDGLADYSGSAAVIAQLS